MQAIGNPVSKEPPDAAMPEIVPRLSTKEAVQFLSRRGFKIAATTLGKYACIGGGPEYEKWGGRRLYRPQNLLEWAESRISPLRTSTSDVRTTCTAAGLSE